MSIIDTPALKEITLDVIYSILEAKTYCCEYQPFVCTKTEKIYAYEALARFWIGEVSLSPERLFEVCHKDKELFFNLELIMKQYQFENRIENKKLFINFDPHVFHFRDGINSFFNLFSKQDDFVIEIVENSHQSVNLENLTKILAQKEFQFAVDDFFKENSMISIELLNNCNYLKLDKDILQQLRRDNGFHHIVKGFVGFSHANGKKLIIEGVESKEDIELVKKTNIDFMQGFFYKDKFLRGKR